MNIQLLRNTKECYDVLPNTKSPKNGTVYINRIQDIGNVENDYHGQFSTTKAPLDQQIVRLIAYEDIDTVKSRYNGFQGTEVNHPLLAKSVIAKMTMVDFQKQNPKRSII